MRNKVIRMADFRQRNKITNQNQLNSFTLFLITIKHESKFKSMMISTILWITFQSGGKECPGGRTTSCSVSCTRLADLPGASGVWMEFHPLIILYITTKITQKTTILTGISKLSQSILPSLSTCNSRCFQDTSASSVCQLNNNGGKQPIRFRENTRARPAG